MTISGYKGFDKDFRCKGFQYEPGQEYTTDKAVICEEGFHFCEYPLDVFGYYGPGESRYAEVQGSGKTDKHEGDSKVACTKLKIGAEVSISALVQASVKFILEKVDWENATESNTGDQSSATNTGYMSAATNTGNRSAATNTGYMSAATNTGNQSAATVEGEESVAIATGYKSRAKGSLGCWIVLAEWKEKFDEWHIKDVKSAKVDGKKIKADTFYTLINGKFVEAE